MTQTTIDIQSFINSHKFSRFQWLVFALCFFIVLLDGFDTASIGYIAPSLLKEWGIAKPDLAPVLSSGLYGLAAGAIFAGPLADTIGRRLVLIISVLVFSSFCFACSFASSLETLTILRFITGLGLGAAMPNALTLVSEYCPDKRRALFTNAMFCAFPLGASLGGFLAASIIPSYGWRMVLKLGGVAPFILVFILIALLPESIRFLAARKNSNNHIGQLLSKIAPVVIEEHNFIVAEPTSAHKNGVTLVLSERYLTGTLMLWLSYFMGLVIFYALINWLPTLLIGAGFEVKQASQMAALFPLGGVGAIASGWLMDRTNANWVVCLLYTLTAMFMFAIGQTVGSTFMLVATLFISGIMMNTAQCSLPSLAANFYPTQGRATGIAWMLGIGRFGAIASTYLIAELVREKLEFGTIFSVIAVPAIIASCALMIKQAYSKQ